MLYIQAINHREVFERGNQDDDAVTSGKDWREYNQSHQDNYQQNHNQSEEDEEEVNQSKCTDKYISIIQFN